MQERNFFPFFFSSFFPLLFPYFYGQEYVGAMSEQYVENGLILYTVLHVLVIPDSHRMYVVNCMYSRAQINTN